MALGAVDSNLADELKQESLEIAEDVRDLAKRKLSGDVATSTGRAAASIRAFSNTRGAGVRGGRASVPYYGWLDFGGTIRHEGSKHTHTTAHLIGREVRREGRYIYPAADEESTRAAPRVERMLDRLFARAGFTG